MRYGEGGVPKSRFLENVLPGFQKLGIEFLQERPVTARRKPGLFVKQSKHSKSSLDNIDTRLVVREINEGPVDLFFDIFLLFQFEHMGIELVDHESMVAFKLQDRNSPPVEVSH